MNYKYKKEPIREKKLSSINLLDNRIIYVDNEKSNKSYKQIKKEATGKDWWLSSRNVLQYGIVDKILGGGNNVLKKHKYRY